MNEEIYKFRIPEELYGQVVDGVDLQILSSDSVRIIEAYIKQEGELSDIQKKILCQCDRELGVVIPRVEGAVKVYFSKVHLGVSDVIHKLKITGSM